MVSKVHPEINNSSVARSHVYLSTLLCSDDGALVTYVFVSFYTSFLSFLFSRCNTKYIAWLSRTIGSYTDFFLSRSMVLWFNVRAILSLGHHLFCVISFLDYNHILVVHGVIL